LQSVPHNQIDQWCRDGHAALELKQFGIAEDCCRKILNADSRNAEGLFLLAMLAVATKQFKPAVELLRRTIAFDDRQSKYHAQLGRILVILHANNEGRSAAESALALEPDDPLTLDTIGCIFSHAGDHEKALPLFRAAVAEQPDNPQFQFNLASSLRFVGDFDGAELAYERAIETQPDFHMAHWSLAFLKRNSTESNHIERLNALLREVNDEPEAASFTHNALAKEFDDMGDSDQAFEHLSRGKSLIRGQMEYSTGEDEELVEALIKRCNSDYVGKEGTGDNTTEPVFIVGMPRTGTTLVERILSSHSDVFSAGELRNFGLQLKRLSGTPSAKVLDPETVELGVMVDPAELGSAYLDSTRPATGHTSRFIDKTPLNFLSIGFIHRSLPNARIICLRRNPMDTCLSNFRQMFSSDSAPYYRYSFDLLETGQYYLLFDKLMRHWDAVLPGKVLTVQYEEVVADQETQSRRIVDFCGLEWQDDCLSFENNAAPVATASSVQVRQPIYSDATARWKRYEKHLQPLKELLEANSIAV
jgi:tetratricopeptide (TPR) repeat protein